MIENKVLNSIKPCKVLIVLDRSGSMISIAQETINGYNRFIEEQKKIPGECKVTLVQFDDVIETVYDDIDINNIPALTNETFIPRGWTALYDAIGKSIRNLETKVTNQKVIVAVITDGEENASKEFRTADQVKALTTTMENRGWNITFIAANIKDVKSYSQSMGIGRSMNYMANSDAVMDMYSELSQNVVQCRTS